MAKMFLDKTYKSRVSEMQDELAKLLSFLPKYFNETNANSIPELPGVYLIREEGKIVYCGSAQNLRLRLWQEHYLGRQERFGSQFRRIISKEHPELFNDDKITVFIYEHCSYSFLHKDVIKKRDLKFLEKFFNSVLRPDYIETSGKNNLWGYPKIPKRPIQYKCENCGKFFISGRQRTGKKLCNDCASKFRREGKGPIQLKKSFK